MLAEGLKSVGITPVLPEGIPRILPFAMLVWIHHCIPLLGSFFIMGDTSKINIPEKYLYPNGLDAPAAPRDYAFCRFLVKEIGVAAIPVFIK